MFNLFESESLMNKGGPQNTRLCMLL